MNCSTKPEKFRVHEVFFHLTSLVVVARNFAEAEEVFRAYHPSEHISRIKYKGYVVAFPKEFSNE